MTKTPRLLRTQIRLRPEVHDRIMKVAYYHRLSMAALVDEVFANLSDETIARHLRWQ